MRLALQCRNLHSHTHTQKYIHIERKSCKYSQYLYSHWGKLAPTASCLYRCGVSLWCNKISKVWMCAICINVIVLYVSAQRRALHLFENFKTAQWHCTLNQHIVTTNFKFMCINVGWIFTVRTYMYTCCARNGQMNFIIWFETVTGYGTSGLCRCVIIRGL